MKLVKSLRNTYEVANFQQNGRPAAAMGTKVIMNYAKFNHGFTKNGHFLEALYNFKMKKAYEARENKFLLQNVQNEILKISRVFKNRI